MTAAAWVQRRPRVQVNMTRRRLNALTLPVLAWLLLTPAALEAMPALHGSVGVASAMPALLDTGMALGVGADVLTTGTLAWGLQSSIGSAAENDEFWAVSHLEWRLRLLGALQYRAGRGIIGLRLGAGFSLVDETRQRHQAERLGASAGDLDTSALALVPGADLQVAVGVAVLGAWGVSLAAGPSVHLPSSGERRFGFVGQVGIARLP